MSLASGMGMYAVRVQIPLALFTSAHIWVASLCFKCHTFFFISLPSRNWNTTQCARFRNVSFQTIHTFPMAHKTSIEDRLAEDVSKMPLHYNWINVVTWYIAKNITSAKRIFYYSKEFDWLGFYHPAHAPIKFVYDKMHNRKYWCLLYGDRKY